MKTKIATTFGLALMLVLGIFGTMLALGLFNSVAPVYATSVEQPRVTVSPDTARDTGAYTILVTGNQNILVGDLITMAFSSTTIPSTISTSNITIKASLVSAGNPNELFDVAAVTVSGSDITITVPDMESDQPGDQSISAGADITISILQAAGLTNPDLADDYTVFVSTTLDVDPAESAVYAISFDISLSSDSEKRGEVITVTGVGLNPDCTICNITFTNDTDVPQTIHGTGSIDGDGVFTGSFTVDSGTATTDDGNDTIRVTDATGAEFDSDDRFTNAPGAVPSDTEAVPGSSFDVELFDFTADEAAVITRGSTTISLDPVVNDPDVDFEIDLAGGSGNSVTDYAFTLPDRDSITLGTHLVVITDSGTLSDSFLLEVVSGVKTLTVTPNPAAIGQVITVQGTDFTETDGRIAVGQLQAAGISINDEEIVVDSVGNWSFVTRLSTNGEGDAGPAGQEDDDIDIEATETGTGVIAESADFNRTAREVTATPDTAAPGSSVFLSGTGMTVDTNTDLGDGGLSVTAEVTITLSSGNALTGAVFPVGSDGAWSGTITLPADEESQTLTITAT